MVKTIIRSVLSVRKTVSALSDVEETDTAPFTGLIESVTLDFPPTDGLVEVFIYHGTTKVLPDSRTGICFSDTTHTFPLCHPVESDDTLKMRLLNHDNTHARTISAVFSIIEIPDDETEAQVLFSQLKDLTLEQRSQVLKLMPKTKK